jgi:hypothetical protein
MCVHVCTCVRAPVRDEDLEPTPMHMSLGARTAARHC